MNEIILSESQKRLYQKLYNDIGSEIINYLTDSDINEVMLNPDGILWVDSVSHGQISVGKMTKTQVFSLLHSVAGINNFVISAQRPCLEAELPYFCELKGQRFTGLIPPVVSSPCFTIRKKSEVIFSIEDYLHTDRMTKKQSQILCELVKERANILVCGGPGSGKTTFTNALIQEVVKEDKEQRFILIEDTPELQCTASNTVSMITSCDVSMRNLLKASMRMRPDRILVGEVRGAEALDMLKAWNTGCPGGICTVHANGCEEAIQRILDLSMESGLTTPPIALVSHTINSVISIVRKGNLKGFVSEIVAVRGYENGEFEFETMA